MNLPNGVISLDCTLKSHIYLVPLKNGYALIDASFSEIKESIIKEIIDLGIKLEEIKYILITHSDYDHIGSLEFLVKTLGIKAYSSQEEINHWMEKGMNYDFIPKDIKEELVEYKKYVLPLPSKTFDEFEIIDTPKKFHSYGMVMFLYKKMLFCGDMIQSKAGSFMLIPAEFNLDEKIYIDFIKNFDTSKIEYICQAHGKPLKAHPEWENLLASIK
ncbi:MAG: MBL fold metallo-hydrolase [Mycoplasmataceae bacterium]|nr:MBL fold metallo-hydrolase [Mycoplasmataceae bacterium]